MTERRVTRQMYKEALALYELCKGPIDMSMVDEAKKEEIINWAKQTVEDMIMTNMLEIAERVKEENGHMKGKKLRNKILSKIEYEYKGILNKSDIKSMLMSEELIDFVMNE